MEQKPLNNKFRVAAQRGDTTVLERHYDKGRGADLDGVDDEGFTALYYAVLYDRREAVAWLMSKGADFEITPPGERKPFVEAAKLGKQCALTGFLVSDLKTSRIPESQYYEAFEKAALSHHTAYTGLQRLVPGGLELLLQTEKMKSYRLLVQEVKEGRRSVVKVILEHYPSLCTDQCWKTRRPPLTYARSKEMVALLLEFGCILDKPYEGRTPYTYAQNRGDWKAADALLAAAKAQKALVEKNNWEAVTVISRVSEVPSCSYSSAVG